MQACRQLYLQYANAMYSVCRRILQQQEEAEDALQEAFIKIFNNIEQYRGDSTIGSWIKQIVTNTCLNILRKRKVVFSELNETLDYHEEETDEEDGQEFTTEAIKEAVALLPDGYRVVFNLYLFEDYSHRQIAEMLEISESTAKTQLFKAKRKLKELLLRK